MSEKEKPLCSSCGGRHWKFTPCEKREEAAARERELAIQRERLKVRPELSVPPGYVRVGVNKFARQTESRPDGYVQVAPGKYVRRGR